MKLHAVSLIGAPLLLALAFGAVVPQEGPEKLGEGVAAPEIDGKSWYNHLGRSPSLQSLRGHAVLIEFWATW